ALPISNWWFLPYAAMVGDGAPDGFFGGAVRNLVVVTAGNVVGGAGLVAAVYWIAYLRHDASDD
ncbi:MAG: formate transporter FocA, partial [Planctomycetota bacterium JB042]